MGQGEPEPNSGQAGPETHGRSHEESSGARACAGCLGCLVAVVIAVFLIAIFAPEDDTGGGRTTTGPAEQGSGVSTPSARETAPSRSTPQRTSRGEYRQPSSTGSSGSTATIPPARRAPEPTTGSAARAKYWVGKCTRVIDGDTIVVSRDGTTTTIRLFGVDCPEKSQQHGAEATSFTTRWLGDSSCSVVPLEKDRYGRTVAWVYRGDRCLNLEIVQNGHGWWYREYAPRNEGLQQAQQQARMKKQGLWANPHPVAPWRYRHNR